MVSAFALNLITITDTAFLGRLGEASLGGAGNGGILYFAFFFIGTGFTVGMQIISGRRNGEQNFNQIGSLVHQSFYFLFGLWAFLLFFIKFILPDLLSSVIQSEAVLHNANVYLQTRAWGLFFALGNATFTAFYIGITRTRLLIVTTPLMAIINIFFDYVLIFGEWGFPEMGVAGAALASNIAEASVFVFFIIYTYFKIDIAKYKLFQFEKPDFDKIGNILRTSGPLMAQNFISLFAWFIFFSLIEHLGEKELAISHIVRSVYFFMMIPVFGLGDACNTLVSNLIGQNQKGKVLHLVYKIALIGLVFDMVFILINFSIPSLVLSIYTNDLSLINDAIPSLQVVSIANLVFVVGVISFRAVSGTGKTNVALLIELISIFFYLAYTYYTVKILQTSVAVVWGAEFVYFGITAILSWYYLKSGKWQHSKV
jgi:putative MATE family efflux protein